MKRKKLLAMVIACIVAVSSFTVTAGAVTLTNWASDGVTIGRWTSSPTIWRTKLTGNIDFTFDADVNASASAWNGALGTSINVVTTGGASSHPIRFYGGTKAQIDALGVFNPLSTTTAGLTSYASTTNDGSYTFNGKTITLRKMNAIDACVVYVSGRTPSQYRNITMHEMGHSMGWYGHGSNSAWIMYNTVQGNTSLWAGEKNHLAQVY